MTGRNTASDLPIKSNNPKALQQHEILKEGYTQGFIVYPYQGRYWIYNKIENFYVRTKREHDTRMFKTLDAVFQFLCRVNAQFFIVTGVTKRPIRLAR